MWVFVRMRICLLSPRVSAQVLRRGVVTASHGRRRSESAANAQEDDFQSEGCVGKPALRNQAIAREAPERVCIWCQRAEEVGESTPAINYAIATRMLQGPRSYVLLATSTGLARTSPTGAALLGMVGRTI